jgi:AcrR family transcriptional regulator
MSEASIVRRASYGPSSPAVGARGASTRSRITEVSLDLFGRLGYFDTSVDAIAKAAGVSRATLYQYFHGKDEIFLELLNECGSALFRVARRIGPLGPDEVGFDNLNWWLGEWSWVFEKYSTMFVQWTAIASSDTKVRPEIMSFVRSYNHRVAERLAASGLTGVDPEVAAMTMTALVHRINLFVHTDRAYGRSAKAAVDTLSVFLQLALFPDTPPSVLTSLRLHASTDPAADVDAIVIPPAPDIDGLSIGDRTAKLSKRAVNTVTALADAGAGQFRARGYRSTSVDDIVEAAEVARGTFYKYFTDKQDLYRRMGRGHLGQPDRRRAGGERSGSDGCRRGKDVDEPVRALSVRSGRGRADRARPCDAGSAGRARSARAHGRRRRRRLGGHLHQAWLLRPSVVTPAATSSSISGSE